LTRTANDWTAVRTFDALKVADQLIDVDNGSVYVMNDLYVDGAIFCNRLRSVPPRAERGEALADAAGIETASSCDEGEPNAYGFNENTPLLCLQGFTQEQLDRNEDMMLTTDCGSKLIMSNLYVEGTIYCNSVTPATISDRVGGGGCHGCVSADSLPYSVNGTFVDFGEAKVNIGALFVKELRVANGGEQLEPPVLTPSLDAGMELLAGGSLYYDNSWTLTVFHDNCVAEKKQPSSGTMIGNGKLGGLSCATEELSGIERLLYNGPVRYEAGVYDGNAYDLFQPCRFNVFEKDSTRKAVSTQSLNMMAGVLTTTSSVEQLVNVSADAYAARNLPYCVVQTVRISPTSPMDSLVFKHDVFASKHLSQVTFNNNTVYNKQISESGIYMLSCSAQHELLGEVACVTAYAFETAFHECLGFNLSKKTHCRHCFRLMALESSSSAKVHMLHVMISAQDLIAKRSSPAEEARRIALTLLGREATLGKSFARIREAHVHGWAEAWRTDVCLGSRASSGGGGRAEVLALKKHVRYALYGIYSIAQLRANAGAVLSETEAEVFPLLDLHGTCLNDCDMFLMPLLAMLKPETALGVLEYRYRNVNEAVRLAASYGFEGAKAPYRTDAVGGSLCFWDAHTALAVFNSALIVLNSWAVYRVLRNADWLRTKGYSMMSNLVTFLCSVVTIDDDGTLHTPKTHGVAGVPSRADNAFTNRVIKLAARSAVEAAWELQLVPDERWIGVADGLWAPISVTKTTLFDADDTPAKKYPVLEPLLLHVPFYVDLNEESEQRTRLAMDVELWTLARLLPERLGDPMSLALIAIAQGRLTQHDAEVLERYENAIIAFVSEAVKNFQGENPWGNARLGRGPCADPLAGALLLSVVLQGACNLRVEGGVAETRFYYEEMRIRAAVTARMPRAWDRVTVKGVGPRAGASLKIMNNAPNDSSSAILVVQTRTANVDPPPHRRWQPASIEADGWNAIIEDHEDATSIADCKSDFMWWL
jgi:hypothetical protein